MGIARKDLFKLPRFFGFLLYLLLLLSMPDTGVTGQWDPLIHKLAADGFSRPWLEALFSRPEVRFDPSVMTEKMKTLYKTKFGDASVRKLQQRLAYLDISREGLMEREVPKQGGPSGGFRQPTG